MTSKILSKPNAMIAIAILLSLSYAFSASKWTYLGKFKELDMNGNSITSVHYYDADSVKSKPPYSVFIVKAVFDRELIDFDTKKPYKYSLHYFRINCAKKLYLAQNLVNYSSTGKRLSTIPVSYPEYSSINEDPIVVKAAQKICRP